MEIIEPTMHGWIKHDFGPQTNWKTQLMPCPTCSDHAIARRKIEQVDRLLGQSHIPLRMAEWSFTTLPANVDAAAKGKAVKFANCQMPKRAIYFHGDFGQGKTGIAISIIQTVMRRGDDAVFIRSLDLLDRLRESYHRGTHEGDDLLALVKSVKWLALDDLATEKPTDYVIQELKSIIERRMDAGLYTIFTSNFSLEQLKKYWQPKDGSFHAGLRVIDRIAEYAEGVPVKGRNLRLVAK
jgi:primosomal protein DnaI